MKLRPKSDFVSMGYRIVKLPRPLPKAEVYKELVSFVESGGVGSLPPSWEVEWSWRNKQGGDLRTASVERAVAESRQSFLGLMARRLRRDAAAAGVRLARTRHRAATEREAEAIEEEEQERKEARAAKEAKRKRKMRRRKKR